MNRAGEGVGGGGGAPQPLLLTAALISTMSFQIMHSTPSGTALDFSYLDLFINDDRGGDDVPAGIWRRARAVPGRENFYQMWLL